MTLYLMIVVAVYALLCSSPRGSLLFAWYDLWVGVFYDRKRRVVYVFLIPCLGVEWQRERRL